MLVPLIAGGAGIAAAGQTQTAPASSRSTATETTPEIQALRDIDVAILPMNLPLDRMRPIPVVECVKTFKPEIVYLYHYDLAYARWLGDPQGPQPNTAQETAATLRVFQDALEGEPVEFRNARWYP